MSRPETFFSLSESGQAVQRQIPESRVDSMDPRYGNPPKPIENSCGRHAKQGPCIPQIPSNKLRPTIRPIQNPEGLAELSQGGAFPSQTSNNQIFGVRAEFLHFALLHEAGKVRERGWHLHGGRSCPPGEATSKKVIDWLLPSPPPNEERLMLPERLHVVELPD